MLTLKTKKNIMIVLITLEMCIIFVLLSYLSLKYIKKKYITKINMSGLNQIGTELYKNYYDLAKDGQQSWEVPWLNPSITNKYNHDGLNDTKNYPIKKSLKTFRIITLGDSFTYGQYVETKDNWTELLESKLNNQLKCQNFNNFEVINLGVPGYDPAYEVEAYYQKGQKYNPDLIIWMLVDERRFQDETIDYELDCYNQQKTKFPNNKDDQDIRIKCAQKSSEITRNKYSSNVVITKQKNNINRIRDFFQGPIFFIDFYNTHHDIIKDINNSTDFGNIYTKNFLLKNYSSDAILFPDKHPNNLGHQLISDAIYNQLIMTKQINCQNF